MGSKEPASCPNPPPVGVQSRRRRFIPRHPRYDWRAANPADPPLRTSDRTAALVIAKSHATVAGPFDCPRIVEGLEDGAVEYAVALIIC